MKVFTSFMLIIFLVSGIGCESSSANHPDAAPSVTSAPAQPASFAAAPKSPAMPAWYNWRGNWNDQDQYIVEMQQGELAADDLAVCHSTLVADGKISNRLRDKCDRIAAKGMAIEQRQAAEEKRKDEAYDKAHHLASTK